MEYIQLRLIQNSDVTDQMIAFVEEKIGCRLPESYYELMRFNHEPEPEVCEFDYGKQTTCVSEFFRFTNDENYEYGILAYLPSLSGVAEQFVPIGRDSGDYLICLDRNQDFAVVLLDRNNNLLHFVARDFNEFLRSLR
ncbi:SMI1 / KNR4 family protein [Gimesia panareensis]|uniref:SMI1 / KNR4 family protein n=1 Tax=Gimesia panareensis TaxID=2527978 RepID=A0A517Q4B2_9PLAN|nr:SMI1/KNR4 family protein [Gimesia panareensis]QDT26448.1 SMI1 / KNR4 family protein [Gimesia panareensis]